MTTFDSQINPQKINMLNADDDVEYTYILDHRSYVVNKPIIGQVYHLSWAKEKAMKWRLISINGAVAYLETPKSKKKLTSKVSDLRHLTHRAEKIARKKYRTN